MAKSKGMTFGHETKGSINASVVTFKSEDLGEKAPDRIEPAEAMIGTRHPDSARHVVIKSDISGTLTLEPSYAEYENILNTFFDGTGSTWTPADDTNGKQFAVVIDRGNSKVFTYPAVTVNTFKVSASENSPVEVSLECLGTTETSAGTVAAVTQASPMIMSDSTISIDASDSGTYAEYFVTSFSIECTENKAERFHNSLTRSSTAGGKFMCTGELGIDINSDTWTDLFAKTGSTSIFKTRIVLTDGVTTYTHTMNDCHCTSPTPTITGDDEVTPTFSFRAFADSNDEITIVKT